MKTIGGFGSAPALALGVGGLAVVGALVALSLTAPEEERADRQDPAATIGTSDPAPAPPSEATPETAPEAIPEAEPEATPETPPEAAPQTTEAAPPPEAPDTPSMPRFPKIDTFRLAPDGEMIVAGQGEPGWDVSILLDDQSIDTPMPDAQGNFVAFLSLPQSDAPRVLSLSMRSSETGEERQSQDQIIIAPTRAAQPREEGPELALSEPEGGTSPAQVASETDTGPSDTSDPAPVPAPTVPPAAQDATGTTPGPAPVVAGNAPARPGRPDTPDASGLADASADPATAPAKAEPAGQTVLLADEEGVRVLQSPEAGPAPEAMTQVALDAISYTETGEVALSGRAPGAHVRIYLDNAPISDTPVAPDGNWRVELPEVDTGVYTLRVDAVDDSGDVTSRVETPFKREDQAVLASRDLQMARDAAARIVTVQPGSTLWAISRETYGRGILYVRVFEANRDQIRDPDLIYPGQVFSLPR